MREMNPYNRTICVARDGMHHGISNRPTLWSLKDAVLFTRLKSLGKMTGECGFGGSAEVVVGLNVFLDCLTTVKLLE
jgi:hypothetical protein